MAKIDWNIAELRQLYWDDNLSTIEMSNEKALDSSQMIFRITEN